MRTSLTHPLQIATLSVCPGYGNVGVTFCPGKRQAESMTGGWDRNLDDDLDTIRDWGAAAIVTLVEHHELIALQVPELGVSVRSRSIDWNHLPFADDTAPGNDFEAAWARAGEGLRARLRAGFNVLVHCKGGIGRAGTIGARLLIELGVAPQTALEAVRAARPGAVVTADQEAFVLGVAPIPEAAPKTTIEAIRDRAIGALMGLAVGDAVGSTLEFEKRDSVPLLQDMIGGGPFGLQPGQWTDDTAMALALAESLIDRKGLDEADLLDRFIAWWEEGAYSCTGACFDIGLTTQSALMRWKREGQIHSGSTASDTAGNGSLMRLAPVAIRYWRDRARLRDAAARQSRTTHAAAEAIDACVAFAEVLADAIEGMPRSEVLRPRADSWSGTVETIMAGGWRGKPRSDIASSGYVAHSLEASLWSVGRTGDFRAAVLAAANLADDADTTAAITGQLAGALYGASAIPPAWVEVLAWRPRIRDVAEGLFQASVDDR